MASVMIRSSVALSTTGAFRKRLFAVKTPPQEILRSIVLVSRIELMKGKKVLVGLVKSLWSIICHMSTVSVIVVD